MHHPPVFDVPRLIHVLEARGLSRTDIARTLQVSPSIVCRWVSQERMPGLRNGLALLELAGVDRSGVPGIR
jgi:predicted transcriptional regulator